MKPTVLSVFGVATQGWVIDDYYGVLIVAAGIITLGEMQPGPAKSPAYVAPSPSL